MRLGRTTPALPVADTGAAADFYRDRLGFTVLHRDPALAVLMRDEAVLHLWAADDTSPWWRLRRRPVCSGAESFLAGTGSCRIECDDPDALHAEMAAAGVLHPVSRHGAADTDHGTREVNVLDSAGNLLTFHRTLAREGSATEQE